MGCVGATGGCLAPAPLDARAVAGTYDYARLTTPACGTSISPTRSCSWRQTAQSLLAQDEAASGPNIRARFDSRGAARHSAAPALTAVDGVATPVLISRDRTPLHVVDGNPDLAAGRPFGLYGNRFAVAPADTIRAAVHVHRPPTRTNLIAIAAPSAGRGPYFRHQLEQILVTAYTGFSAAIAESRRLWPTAAVEVRTGFWGCGAFGGNRRAMTLLQLLAARLAGVDRLRFYVFDDAGDAAYRAGAATRDATVIAAGTAGEPLCRRSSSASRIVSTTSGA